MSTAGQKLKKWATFRIVFGGLLGIGLGAIIFVFGDDFPFHYNKIADWLKYFVGK